MRSIGTHRGNSVLRSMIQQTGRRRLYANLVPSQADTPIGADPATVRWSRAFFDRLRDALLPRMAVAASLEEGELRYFGGADLSLWALASPHAIVVAYDHQDSPQQIRDRARRWRACLQTRTAPGLASPHWGHPVYGARVDPLSGELDVVWATLGSWFDFALRESGPIRDHDLPRHWQAAATGAA